MASKREILIEANVNTWLGFVTAWLITWLMIRYSTLSPFWTANIICGLCTISSLARNYFVRWYFSRRFR